MVKFDFKVPAESYGSLKATVHKDGKLGFSSGAENLLNLSKDESYFLVATNAEDSTDKSLYFLPAKKGDVNVFKASKAGNYYYMRIKHILDEMGIDYETSRVIYDIKKKEMEGKNYFHFIMRSRQ
jgi:hypothetical protein